MYDATDAVWLTPQYTTLTTYTYSGLTPGHNYVVGVAASACPNGPYGPSFGPDFSAPIIIIDVLVENSCTLPQNSGPTNSSFFIYLVPATQNGSTVEVSRIKVTRDPNTETDPVVFMMWADCQKNVHYQFESMPTGMIQTPANGQTQAVEFKFANNSPYFIIHHPIVTASGLIRVTIDITGPSIRGYLRSCNLSEPYNCRSNIRTARPNGEPEPEFVTNLSKPNERDVVMTSAALPALSVSPNPFSNVFQVQYQLPAESRVSLTLLDLNGKVIQTVNPEGVFPAGEHVTSFQQENLPAGLYFMVLQTDQARIVASLIKQP